MLTLALVTLTFWFIAGITLALLAVAVIHDSNPLDDAPDDDAEALTINATDTHGEHA